MMGENKPCILIVNKEISFLRKNVKKDFKDLKEKNIF